MMGRLKAAWKQDRKYLTVGGLHLCVTLLNIQSPSGESDWLGLGQRPTSLAVVTEKGSDEGSLLELLGLHICGQNTAICHTPICTQWGQDKSPKRHWRVRYRKRMLDSQSEYTHKTIKVHSIHKTWSSNH